MSKELAPLTASRNQTLARPTVYKDTEDSTVDGWLLLMRHFLERVHVKSTEIYKPWPIFDHLEGEARKYIINKSEPGQNEPEKVFFTLLASRFGIVGNKIQVSQMFMSGVQQEKEDWMQYLDALEGLRTQGFPDEPITTKNYEILQRFTVAIVFKTLYYGKSLLWCAWPKST